VTEESSPSASGIQEPIVLEGIGGSPGLVIGRAVIVDTGGAGFTRRHIPKHAADEEMVRYDAGVEAAATALREVADRVRESSAGRAELSILEAYVLMVEDESLREEVERRVRIDRQCVEWALDTAVKEMAAHLSQASDAYLAERSHDFEFVAQRIQLALSGAPRSTRLPATLSPAVVVAHDLSPAETAGFTRDRVNAMVTEVGTRTSHTSILARALEIPAVVGVRDIVSCVGTGDLIIVDGQRGRVVVSPTPEMVAEAEARAARHARAAQTIREWREKPAETACGVHIELGANIELPAEAETALAEGAEGIGLYRTEFLYVDRAEPPDEEEQYRVFCSVLDAMRGHRVTLRTFDIGGDKFVSAFQVPTDMNPALGLRAVRLGLARPELFLVQLRAMVRASAHGDLRIMVPMVATVGELRAVRELLEQAVADVERAGHPHADDIPLGIMIEVPSAAVMADELAKEAAFFSVGTNDLVQYALAVDRGSAGLAYLASPFDPAILRLLDGVVRAGERHHCHVSVCGAMASDPIAAVLLVGMGVRALSVEAAAIPRVKSALSRFGCDEAAVVAQKAIGLALASDVDALLAHELGPRLADLLDTED